MEPFSLLIGLALTGYVIGGVATDFVAVAKRQTPPSIQKARDRHERKLARGEESNPAPSYLGRIVGNAAERWATRSDQKHRDRLDWIEEQNGKRSKEWLQRKRARAARYERAAQAIANKRGVLWGKTRDAAEALRERRAENEAWRRNASAPDPIDPDASDNPYRVYSEDGRSWHRPVHYDDDGTGWALHPDGTRSRVTDSPEQEERIEDGLVTTGQDATILEFRRPGTEPTESPIDDDSLTADELARLNERQVEMVRSWRRSYAGPHVAIPPEDWYSLPPDIRGRLLDEAIRTGGDPRVYPNGQDRVDAPEVDTEAAQYMQHYPASQGAALESDETPTGTEQSMTEQTPNTTATTNDTAEPSYETISLTATLDRTLASSRQCTALVAEWDQRSVMLTEESKKLDQQAAGIETQIASLQQAENSGDEITQLRTAQEQYTAAKQLIDEQQQAATQVIEAYQAAASAFDQAHAGFQQQVAGQEFYAANNGAGNKDFLTQG